jgi:hypothetical protein
MITQAIQKRILEFNEKIFESLSTEEKKKETTNIQEEVTLAA